MLTECRTDSIIDILMVYTINTGKYRRSMRGSPRSSVGRPIDRVRWRGRSVCRPIDDVPKPLELSVHGCCVLYFPQLSMHLLTFIQAALSPKTLIYYAITIVSTKSKSKHFHDADIYGLIHTCSVCQYTTGSVRSPLFS